jgi:hypothetical protein
MLFILIALIQKFVLRSVGIIGFQPDDFTGYIRTLVRMHIHFFLKGGALVGFKLFPYYGLVILLC